MHITAIKVEGLHNAIDADLTFSSDLGIIVGINGSGKTSLINLTANLLRVNLPQLLTTDFEMVQISGKDPQQRLLTISATKKGGILTISAKRSNRVIDRLIMPIPPSVPDGSDREEDYAFQRSLRRYAAELSDSKLMLFIRDNVQLTLVKLDRTLFAEDFSGAIAIDNPMARRGIRGPEVRDPVHQVEMTTREKFTDYQNQLKRLNEDLINKIVLQLFHATDVFAQEKRVRMTKIADQKKITALETAIKKSSFYPKTKAEQQIITEYFQITKILARELPKGSSKKGDSVWHERFLASALSRFDRLNMLASEFDEFDRKTSEAFREVGKYLTAINSFLAESKKEAFFSEVDNTLRFRLIGAVSNGRPISELSSGEKQIITVLAYLAYMSGENSIFVIDEPELSLHLSWQKGLVSALKLLQPNGCQIIMATHSPEIVGLNRSKVVRLVPRYRHLQ